MNTPTPPLYAELERRGIGVKSLARLAGTDRDTARRVFRGLDVNLSTAEAVATLLGVHHLDLFEAEAGRWRPRDDVFICPPYPSGRGVNTSSWEAAYGSHPDAAERRREWRDARLAEMGGVAGNVDLAKPCQKSWQNVANHGGFS